MVGLWSSFVSSISTYKRGSWSSRDLFIMLNLLQGGAIAAIVPLFSAAFVNVERERGTWDLLRTTPQSISSILVGKIGSSMLFVWLILSSLIPLYSILLPLGGISLSEFFVPAAVITEVLFVIALIGLYCSVRWDNLIKAITMTYFLGFMYLFGFSFARTLICEVFLGRERWGYEMLLSPCVVLICYFANKQLPDGVGIWAQQHPYSAHAVAVSSLIVLLIGLCYFELRRRDGRRRGDGWYPRILRLFERGVFRPKNRPEASGFPDGRNPVFIKDFRQYLGKRGASKTIVIYVLAGFLFVFWIVAMWKGRGSFYASLTKISIPCLMLFPLLILPTAVSSFRREFDRDSYTLLSTTTLRWKDIRRAKKWAGLVLFFIRITSFCVPLLLMVLFSSPNTSKPIFMYNPQVSIMLSHMIVALLVAVMTVVWLILYFVPPYSARKVKGVYVIGIGVVFAFYLAPLLTLSLIASLFFLQSIGAFASCRAQKTVTAYLIAFGIAVTVYFIIPVLCEVMLVINRNAQWYLNLRDIQNIVSPFFLSLQTEANREFQSPYWQSMVFSQSVWMILLGLLFHYFTRIPSLDNK